MPVPSSSASIFLSFMFSFLPDMLFPHIYINRAVRSYIHQPTVVVISPPSQVNTATSE